MTPRASGGVRVLLATIALVAAALAGCTPEAAIEPDTATPPPEPTHAIVYFEERWSVPAATATSTALSRVQGADWRISGIDLATGEETVLAEETSATSAPSFSAVLSPDAERLLYGVTAATRDARGFARFALPDPMQLHLLDLRTGEDIVVCPQPVRSFGWDGADIIATTWRGVVTQLQPTGETMISNPPANAILRISGSSVTTVVPEATARDTDTPDPAETTQFEFLGSDGGDLYFNEGLDAGDLRGYGPDVQGIWRLSSGETSPTIALSLMWGRWPLSMSGVSNRGQRVFPPPANPYAGFLGNGLFPVQTVSAEISVVEERVPPSEDPPHGVEVRRASDMEVIRSVEMTDAIQWGPLLDPAVTRWADTRRLGPPNAPVFGTWLCETDFASLETTLLANVSLDASSTVSLGYLGPDLDILYATWQSSLFQPTFPVKVFVWERAAGESRTLIELLPRHERSSTRVELIGGASLEPRR